MKYYLLYILFSFFPYHALSNDGDLFTAKTAEGIDMKFKIISEADKTCQVGSGNSYEPAISTSYSGSVTVPSTVNGYTVVGVGSYSLCYSGNNKLTFVNLPNTITYIGISSFAGCSSLTSIYIPNTVKEIGAGAFSSCTGLKEIELPSNLTTIGNSAFNSCRGLSSIIIPNSVTDIGERAFEDCISMISIKRGIFFIKMPFAINIFYYRRFSNNSLTSEFSTLEAISNNFFFFAYNPNFSSYSSNFSTTI